MVEEKEKIFGFSLLHFFSKSFIKIRQPASQTTYLSSKNRDGRLKNSLVHDFACDFVLAGLAG